MGIFWNFFNSKYNSKQLSKSYKSQKKDKKYDFLTFSFLECSNNGVSSQDYFKIFLEAYDTLKNENKLSQEEIWILLDLGIQLKLGKIDLVSFMADKIVHLPKLNSIYSIFIQYPKEEREIISSISFAMWDTKVRILNTDNRLADGDDSYNIFNKLTSSEKNIWKKYNNELYQKII